MSDQVSWFRSEAEIVQERFYSRVRGPAAMNVFHRLGLHDWNYGHRYAGVIRFCDHCYKTQMYVRNYGDKRLAFGYGYWKTYKTGEAPQQ